MIWGSLAARIAKSTKNTPTGATVIRDIRNGQYHNPVRVVAFNTAEGWSRDVTEDIAREILDLAHRKAEPLSKAAQAFVEWATGDEVPANLMDRS